MQEKASADKREMTEKTKESDFAISYDRVCIYSRIEKIESTKKDIYNSSGMKTKG